MEWEIPYNNNFEIGFHYGFVQNRKVLFDKKFQFYTLQDNRQFLISRGEMYPTT